MVLVDGRAGEIASSFVWGWLVVFKAKEQIHAPDPSSEPHDLTPLWLAVLFLALGSLVYELRAQRRALGLGKRLAPRPPCSPSPLTRAFRSMKTISPVVEGVGPRLALTAPTLASRGLCAVRHGSWELTLWRRPGPTA